MKSDSNGKQASGAAAKEESRKMRQGLAGPPQITLDPERRRDFFNRLLEKYSTKSTKISNPPGVGFGPRSARFPSVPPTKTPNKIKDKFLKKKKSVSERSIVKSATTEDFSGLDPMECWKNSIRNHVFDTSVYKNHVRIRARSPYSLPIIEELMEPNRSSDESDLEETKSGETKSFESISHSFTLLPCGDQKHGTKENFEIHYEEKIVEGEMLMPEELQARHLTKTSSGTLIWKRNKKINPDDTVGKESKSSRDLRGIEDVKSFGEGEDRPPSKKGVKTRRIKVKKNASAQELDESAKIGKPTSQEMKNGGKPSSSLPQLSQEESKSGKKLNEKIKKPKKLTKKQTFTVVTSKPSV